MGLTSHTDNAQERTKEREGRSHTLLRDQLNTWHLIARSPKFWSYPAQPARQIVGTRHGPLFGRTTTGIIPGSHDGLPQQDSPPPRNAAEENMQPAEPLDNRRHARDKSLTKHQRRDSEKEAKGTTSTAPYSAGYGKTNKKKETPRTSQNFKINLQIKGSILLIIWALRVIQTMPKREQKSEKVDPTPYSATN